MKDTKTVFKFFTIPEYQKEEQYLSDMHEKGWMLTGVTSFGFYHFKKCEPQQVSYRLDYNQEGVRNKDEYVQMFSDCGWEYLFDFVGYSYFRKAKGQGEDNEEIFCDDASRVDMMKRVFKGRVVPLIFIFFCMIVPQFIMNTIGYGSRGVVQKVLSGAFLFLALLYIGLFGMYGYQFYQYEKKLYDDDRQFKGKYIGIAGILVFFLLLLVLVCVSAK